MKKIFGLLVTSYNIKKTLNLQKSLYEKISKTFDEFFIINLINLQLFKKRKLYNNDEYFNNRLPHNFKIITPANKNELNKFLINKNLVAFMGFGKRLENFRIFFLIKKYNVRLIFLQNTDAGNHYLGREASKNRRIENPIFFSYRLGKLITYCLIKLLTFFNLFSRIDICFASAKAIVDNCNNSIGKKIEKIFPFLKISYFKKIVHINSRSFDMMTKPNLNLSEEKIVFIDGNFDHGDRIIRESKPGEELRLKYFNQLNQFLLKLSNIFNKKVTICLHPTTDLDTCKKYFGSFEICKYQTSENIRQAFIVVFHDSSIISDAIFLRKKIISLKSNTLGKHYNNRIDFYQKKLGLFSYSLDEKRELNNVSLQAELGEITNNYDHYIEKEIMKNNDQILGEDRIINTVKKEYFAE
jgi:hypothetical protein